jgi:hypothetical protein
MLLLLAECAVPAPIAIYEDKHDSIWLMFDPEAGAGHSHPASIAPEQLAIVLRGVRGQGRDVIGGFGLFQEDDSAPVFSLAEITLLAPFLSQALKKASPQDMVTFYLTVPDPNRGKLVTSGGLFVRGGRLYLILANARTSPSSVQYENTYEIDTRDQPLLPIARYKFTVGFTPREAWIPNAQAKKQDGYEGYVDESKLLVIDLSRLPAENPSSPTPSPAGQPASRPHP